MDDRITWLGRDVETLTHDELKKAFYRLANMYRDATTPERRRRVLSNKVMDALENMK